MNKSKFLKKSLAAILSVLLVVAMIPLSAAAEVWPENPVPDMTRLYINGNGVKVDGNGVFAADIGSEDTSVALRVDETSLGTAGYNEAELHVLSYQSVVIANIDETGDTIDFDDVAEDPTADEITMDLRLVSTANNESYKEFKVKLTRSTVHTTAEIETAKPEQSTGMFKADIGDHVINVEVARAADGSNNVGVLPVIKLTAKENAVIYGTKVYDAMTGGTNLTTAATAKNTVYVRKVTNGDTISVVSQSGNNTAEWTFKVTKVDSLNSFSVNGVAGVISDADSDGVPDTVTVSLEAGAFTDRLGNNESPKNLPVTYVVRGNVGKVCIGADSAVVGACTDVASSADYSFTKPAVNTPVHYELFVPAGDDGTNKAYQRYDLVIELKKSNNTAIESVIINEQVATIDGDTIHAVLPVEKAKVDISGNRIPNDVAAIDEITIVTDDTIDSVYMDGATVGTNFFGAATTANGKKTWANSGSDKANLTKGKGTIITVKAQNGDIQQYVISAEIDTDRTLAKLDALTLVAPDGTRYDGAISGHKISFKDIPYMTTSLSGWKLFATPNTSATAKIGTTAVINGTAEGDDLFTDTKSGTSTGLNNPPANRTRTYSGLQITAENKNDNKVKTVYDTELSLAAPKTGNTLNSITVSAQTKDPMDKNADTTRNDPELNNVVYDRITTANTIKGVVEKNKTGNGGKVTFKQPFSLSKENSQSTGVYDIITELVTNNGGVAYIGDLNSGTNALSFNTSSTSSVGKMSVLADDRETFGSSYAIVRKTRGLWGNLAIVVLPEEIARTISSSATTIAATDTQYGTIYNVKDEALDPERNANLKSIAVGDTTLTISGDKITGTLPYSLTVDGTSDPTDDTNAKWVKFETQSAFAAWKNAFSEGKKPDGTTTCGADNLKFIFARTANHTVKVYTWNGTTVAKLKGPYGNPAVTTLNAFKVEAEDRLAGGDTSERNYKFDLKWADPNTEAKIEKFSVAGRTGTISGQNVNVSVPYKTDVRGLIPTFTLSSGATMKLDDASNNPVESEKTTLDFSNPVKVIVTSEDGQHTEHYTITVTEGEMFSDVHESDWFYDVVIEAAQKGWINGDGNGHFEPKKTMDRAEFAQVIANMYKDEVEKGDYSSSRFPDVPSDHWASKAIAFCADRGYILGDSKGNFNPGDSITREQAAVILCRMKDLDTTAGRTTFADDASIADWAVESVNAVVKANYFQGVGNNQFDPKRPMMKCEGAAILVRSATK